MLRMSLSEPLRFACFPIAAWFAFAAAAPAATYIVSNDGDDSAGAGTFENPWKTISRASEAAEAGDTVHLRGGIYREVLRPLRNGLVGAPIVYASYPGEVATLSALEIVDGWSAPDGDGIQTAFLDSGLQALRDQIFVNGAPMEKARWPNVADRDPMTHEGAEIEASGSSMSQVKSADPLPAEWADGDLEGAAIWILAHSKWRAWNATVTGFDASNRTFVFPENTHPWFSSSMNPGKVVEAYGPSVFVLNSARILLDAPEEWWLDRTADQLYLIPPAGVDPRDPNQVVEAKARMLTIDLANRSHIVVEGVLSKGAGADLRNASYCQIRNVHFEDFDYRRGGTFQPLGSKLSSGVEVSGVGNVIRDCEFTRCSEGGVLLQGTGNALINCYLHEMDYHGYDGGPVREEGYRNLISHNTIERVGRRGIGPSGLACLVQNNYVSEVNVITRDAAAIYVGGSDGGNTQIRFNWINITNGNPESKANGLYLDNFTQNFLIYRNFVWNSSGRNSLQPNRPINFTVWANNTVDGNINPKYGPWDGPDTTFGTLVHNNLAVGEEYLNSSFKGISYSFFSAESNLANLTPGELGVTFSPSGPVVSGTAVGVDAATFLPGINTDYIGTRPDIGALEGGALTELAGHNFENPPRPYWEPAQSYYRNYLVNGSFEWHTERAEPAFPVLYGWERSGAALAAVKNFPGFNSPPPVERNSIHKNSVHLQGETDDGIIQTIENLPAGNFTFGGYVRLEDAFDETDTESEVEFWVEVDGTRVASTLASNVSTVRDQRWRLLRADFTLDAPGTVRVGVVKLGAGSAYVDHLGVIPLFNDLETPIEGGDEARAFSLDIESADFSPNASLMAELTFFAEDGVSYSLQYASDLSEWNEILVLLGDGTLQTVPVSAKQSGFFRVSFP
jgi:hypothetical protein